MADKNLSVDEILQELQLKKAKVEKTVPKSDLAHVNMMIEQIVKEKKEKELKKQASELTKEERESFEKEIKAQTRTISKLYEKMQKENTRQIKKQMREEKAVEKELHLDPTEAKAFELEQVQKTHTLKLSPIQPNQKVKVQAETLERLNSERKQEKLNELKQTAHNERIKKELSNITEHFGHFKMEDKHVEDSYAKFEINEKNYKEYKKNRNKKIEKFVLNETSIEHNARTEEIPQKKVVPVELQEETQPQPKEPEIVIEQQDVPLENNPIEEEPTDDKVIHTVTREAKTNEFTRNNAVEMDDEEEFEYTDPSQNESITQQIAKTNRSYVRRVIGFTVLSLLAVALSFFQIADVNLSAFGLITITPNIYVMTNMGLILAVMALSYDMFAATIQSMVDKNPAVDSLYCVATLVCFVNNLLLLFNSSEVLTKGVQLFTPVLTVALLLLYVSKYMKAKLLSYNFDFIKNEEQKERCGITTVDDFAVKVDMTKGVVEDEPFLLKTVRTKFFNNFFAHNKKPDTNDHVSQKVLLYAIVIALFGGIVTYVFSQSLYVTATIASAIMVLAVSFIGSLFFVFPVFDTKKVLSYFNALVPNQDAIDEYNDVNSILLDAYDLFPDGTVILHGIKTFSGKRIDEAIVNAASVICESRSILSNVFLSIIANNKSLLKPVDSIIYEDLMGISAWVDNKRVLIGNRELMIHHSIAVPSKSYEQKYQEQSQEVVYLATEGELSAVFILELKAEKEIFNVLQVLERNEIAAVIKSVDSCLTPALIAKLFSLEEGMVKVLPARLHNAYYAEIKELEKMDAVLATDGTVESYVISTVATKKLSNCIKQGIVLYITSIVIGLAALFFLFFTNRINLITNLTMLIYMGAVLLIYIFKQKSIHL